MASALLGGGLQILGGLFSRNKYNKEMGRLVSEIRRKYLPEYYKRTLSEADEMKKSLLPFYDQYMQEGSPLLAARQRKAYESVVTQGERAAGNVQQKLVQSGYGFTPSGMFTGAMGDLSRSTAKSAADAYLENLLQNEMFRFQAAQGKGDVYKTQLQTFEPTKWIPGGGAGGAGGGRDWGSVAQGVGKIFGAFGKTSPSITNLPLRNIQPSGLVNYAPR